MDFDIGRVGLYLTNCIKLLTQAAWGHLGLHYAKKTSGKEPKLADPYGGCPSGSSSLKIGGEYEPPKWSGNIGARYTRSLSPESARHSLAGTVPDNPGAPATRPAGPGLPEGGDAADYD